jgi:peptidoglycan/xylan/chitin deacetylase (PgdA/CDA1 family)
MRWNLRRLQIFRKFLQSEFMKLILLFLLFSTVTVVAQERQIAVTIDDLPVVSPRDDLKIRQSITKNLIAKVKKANVPAIGFVNENKLYADDKRVEAEVDLLRIWLDSGFELGNHTFSHVNIADVSLDKYKAEILQGEIITKELLEAKSLKMQYFRHPYLWTGLSLDIKKDLGNFLGEHNYTIAPVTVDNADYIFAAAYEKAFAKGDKKLMKQIGKVYVPYLDSKMDYWERQSVKLFNREIKQILLLHANFINSVYFGEVANVLKKRGYKFIKLEDALKDEAYKLPDNFVKRNGISWLHRWALDKGKEFVLPDEPKVPEFVMKASGFDSE